MSDVFVIRNQHGHYWGKGKAWVSGADPKAVMRARHHDDALNTLFELSSRDVELRGEVLAAALTARGEPDVQPSQVPLPEDDNTPAAHTETEPELENAVDTHQSLSGEAS